MKSQRLQYRKFDYDDIDDLFEILGNPNVCEYLPGEGAKTKEEAEKWLTHFIRNFDDEHQTHIFAISELDTEKVIGYGGLGYVKEFDKIEIMYGFNQSVWGRGYATEASLRMKELAKELELNDLIALADIHNIASQKVLLKTGFIETEQIHLWGLDVYLYKMNL